MKRDDIETDAGDWLSVDSDRYDDVETDAGDWLSVKMHFDDNHYFSEFEIECRKEWPI